MTKAEERALETYPVDIQLYVESREKPGEWLPVDRNLRERLGYQEGYKQAEKDMMKEAIPCEVIWHDGHLLDCTQEQLDNALERIGANVGDRVRVIVLKKED